jgi:hypothetical protein
MAARDWCDGGRRSLKIVVRGEFGTRQQDHPLTGL